MPDHPSWPAELVEKARRAINENVAERTLRRAQVGQPDAEEHIVRAVLSALSGDLVPREQAVVFTDDHEVCDGQLTEARSQADALAEALDYLIARCEREWCDQDQSPTLDFVMLAVQEVKPRLASYRKTTSSASGETEGEG